MIKVIYFSSFVCSVDFADPYDSEVKYMELEVQGPNFKLTLSFHAATRPSGLYPPSVLAPLREEPEAFQGGQDDVQDLVADEDHEDGDDNDDG